MSPRRLGCISHPLLMRWRNDHQIEEDKNKATHPMRWWMQTSIHIILCHQCSDVADASCLWMFDAPSQDASSILCHRCCRCSDATDVSICSFDAIDVLNVAMMPKASDDIGWFDCIEILDVSCIPGGLKELIQDEMQVDIVDCTAEKVVEFNEVVMLDCIIIIELSLPLMVSPLMIRMMSS